METFKSLDVLYHGPLREGRFPGKPHQEQQ